jgi:drug/metabolite transporter (DMT)-like permease
MTNKKLISNFMLILTAIIWGTAFVAQSIAHDHIGTFTFNAARNIVGALVLIPYIIIANILKRNNSTESDLENKEKLNFYDRFKLNKNLIIGGILCGLALFGGSTFQQFGIKYTSAGKSGFITALYIIFVPAFGIFLKKKVPFKIWLCILIALVGFYLISIKDGFVINKGDLLTLICSFFFALHILVIDYYSPKVDGVIMSCIQFFVTGLISLMLSFIFESPQMSSLLAAWKPILYVGVFSCGIAYTLQIVGQKNTEPVTASLILSMESVFAVIAGWLILKQGLLVKEAIGCLLVFTAIIITQLPGKNVKMGLLK